MLLALLVVAIGLLWRTPLLSLPGFIAKYGGDALWGLLVFVVFAIVLSRASTRRVALIAGCFASSIEFLQLYHAPWIDLIRSTRIGHLVLGSTFNAPDLIAYIAGIVTGAFAERACFSTNPKVDRQA